ncbi:MAG: orotidine 5'-phosphate decarboxylase [Candidatus Doudnabacteria bacterium RIFCSPLOWO2_01_FULL_44_21]|uniref:Orotidine 5'-phosphate decarboxylase n=1 Tax=Candidatus Doudnabacteria bacterium RIFCSPLOWO2_01_FULL_44_21 TaxID=1817841 RepID=A0A1F5Q2T3_9BACT|nr:MAG: orotidine 5'-phosphate decarboxylase [Candidatus Doudnabacteria bacterium RIFCSPHIGHO2_02_FULL_43_13b]OGE96434.1 MAG: orotidine 5'-phosphate decarboxylase [Candidatus Doudnabacteria bacterium RIFCSPLOWO2_01_FULL_44_21]
MVTTERVILAADELSLEQCTRLVGEIGDRIYAVKVHNLYDKEGPGVVQLLRKAGASRVWVDAKLHDIPNTVKLRAQAIADSGADIVTVHASGEIEMMMAALESGITVYAITVLTSLDEEQAHLLHGQPTKAQVLYLARLAKLAGVHGVVSSPKEVGILAKRPELKGLELVTPGIRSAGKDAGDQKRVDTPTAAIKTGSTRLVVGRQLTASDDPVRALDELEQELVQAG